MILTFRVLRKHKMLKILEMHAALGIVLKLVAFMIWYLNYPGISKLHQKLENVRQAFFTCDDNLGQFSIWEEKIEF